MRRFVDNFTILCFSTASLFGSMTLLSVLSCTVRTAADSLRPFPFLPLSILVLVLLGFLFELLTGTGGQGRAGDDSRGNCEGGARRRAGRGGRSGDRVLIAVL